MVATLAIVAAVALAHAEPNLRPTAEQTSLALASQPGDYVGQGSTYQYSGDVATFTPATFDGGVQCTVYDPATSAYWTLTFAAPSGLPLSAGTFVNATRARVQEAGTPGIDVGGIGRGCNRVAGDFEIKQLAMSGGTVTGLWVRFEQHCEAATPALTGDLRYHADVSVIVTAPFKKRPIAGDTVVFDVQATPVAGEHVVLSVDDPPDGASFVDHGDNTGTFTWQTDDSRIGDHPLTFRGVSAAGEDHSTTIVQVLKRPLTGDTSLQVDSQAGDYVGQGQHVSYGATDGVYAGYRYNGSEAVSLLFQGPQHGWNFAFGAPSNAVLTPGLYTDATDRIQ